MLTTNLACPELSGDAARIFTSLIVPEEPVNRAVAILRSSARTVMELS